MLTSRLKWWKREVILKILLRVVPQTLLVFPFFVPCFSPDFDANNIFKAFFGGPGGFSFEGEYAYCS